MDAIDQVFRWRCGHCGDIFEDSNKGALEARIQCHTSWCGKDQLYDAKVDPDSTKRPQVYFPRGKTKRYFDTD